MPPTVETHASLNASKSPNLIILVDLKTRQSAIKVRPVNSVCADCAKFAVSTVSQKRLVCQLGDTGCGLSRLVEICEP